MPEIRIRDYVIEGRIGNGGMGSVFLARHHHLGMKLALKVLHQHLTSDETIRARFLNEAKLMAELRHPNIVELREYFEEKGSLVLVMEYIAGRNLDEMIGTEVGPIPWERTLPLYLQVLEGIGYAHTKGVIHRDIKPANILISNQGLVKITDFGIAKIAGKKGLTKTGAKLGTIYYMSPEQIRGSRGVDHRSDIYSLGMTLYEMLAGCLPFNLDEETSEFVVMKTIVDSSIPDPREYYPHIPEWLVGVVKKAISPEPDERFESCAKMSSFLSSNAGGIESKGDYWSDQVNQLGLHEIDKVGSIYSPSTSASEAAGKCPDCNILLSDGAMFCSSCGMDLATSCPGCSSKISRINKFCPSCGIDVQKKITDIEAEKERQRRRAEEQHNRREEAERERKVREENLRREREEQRKRRKIWWSSHWWKVVSPAVMVSAVIGIISYLGSDSYAYSQAEDLYASGDLEAAASAYAALDDFKDARQRQLTIEYEIAEQVLASGDRERAISAFSELGHYNDSEERIKEIEYAIAEDLLESGNRSAAATAFQCLGAYNGSSLRAQSIRYDYAEDLLESGDHNAAIGAFQRLGTYSDATQRVQSIRYDLAEVYLEAGNLSAAEAAFEQLGDYRDSQERVWEARGFEKIGDIITDSNTGLQWRVKPGNITSWYDTRDWVNGLGSNWRMPTLLELKDLYNAGITRDDWGPFENSGSFVWSVSAWYIFFEDGCEDFGIPRDYGDNFVGFAVRSQ